MPFSLCHRKTFSFWDLSHVRTPSPAYLAATWEIGNERRQKAETGADPEFCLQNIPLFLFAYFSNKARVLPLIPGKRGVGIIGATISRPWLKRNPALTLWPHLVTGWLQLKAAMASCSGILWVLCGHSCPTLGSYPTRLRPSGTVPGTFSRECPGWSSFVKIWIPLLWISPLKP